MMQQTDSNCMKFSFSLPQDFKGTLSGYRSLGDLAAHLAPLSDVNVEINGLSRWCDGHLCAPLGAILSLARQRNVHIIVGEEVATPIKLVWGKNGFWPYVGGVNMIDTNDTTLAFEQFNATDEKRFAQYVARELLPKELPKMSDSAKKRFGSSVQETFNNAISHTGMADGERVFCCGQHYPTGNRLAFCIADLGVGFQHNVERFLSKSCPNCASIDWALDEGNTTKGRLGGLGLTLLWEWIQRNEGRLQIVSQSDYWEGSSLGIKRFQLPHSFPGTVVTLHINTWDEKSYEDFFAVQSGPLF